MTFTASAPKSLSGQQILFHVFLAYSFTLLVNVTTKPWRIGRNVECVATKMQKSVKV